MQKSARIEQLQDPEAHLRSSVEGTVVEFDNRQLRQTADLPQIRKLYKLDAPTTSKAGNRKGKKATDSVDGTSTSQTNGVYAELDDVLEMEAVILGIMALKGS